MKHSTASLFLSAALALAGLTGCAGTPAQQDFPDLSYRYLAPINLAVGGISVESRYIPPLKAPNVEHNAPVPPYNALRQWGLDRLHATGGADRARMVILHASIIETRLAVTEGLKGAFTRDQAARYDGKLAAMVEVLDSSGRQRAYATARAERSQTVPEGATLAEREKVWFTLTEDMMRQINEQLETNVARHLRGYMPVR
jgi:hypothetical protein